jgi:hypothetical protein
MVRFSAGVGTLAGLAFASAALAAQPLGTTLTPSPPPWYSCKPAGNGTVCQGSHTEVVAPYDTGIPCGSGANAFTIFDSGVPTLRATRYYDADGNLTRRIVHESDLDGRFANPRTAAGVPYTQTVTITDELAVPGDLSSATETNVGENLYRDADHSIVFRSVGRFVTSPAGDVEFRSGKQDFLDVFVDGDPTALERLCSTLGA